MALASTLLVVLLRTWTVVTLSSKVVVLKHAIQSVAMNCRRGQNASFNGRALMQRATMQRKEVDLPTGFDGFVMVFLASIIYAVGSCEVAFARNGPRRTGLGIERGHWQFRRIIVFRLYELLKE